MLRKLSPGVVISLLLAAGYVTVVHPVGSQANVHCGQTNTSRWPEAICYAISADCDDGTEKSDVWYPEGLAGNLDHVGCDCDGPYCAGLRFCLADLSQGDTVEYARPLLATQGGILASRCTLVVRGVAEDSPEAFSQTRRPSQLPKTATSVVWYVTKIWPCPGSSCAYYCCSPDISGIINEILARPDWGQGSAGKTIALTIEEGGSSAEIGNYLRFEDSSGDSADPGILEIYPTLTHAFIGKPVLGRPTSSSVTINVINLVEIDIYAEYGEQPTQYTQETTSLLNQPACEKIELEISNLQPNCTYYYRLRFRRAGGGTYLEGAEGHFRTQCDKHAEFVFAIQSDSHLYMHPLDADKDNRLYINTLENIATDDPDFIIDLGDFADLEPATYVRGVLTQSEAVERYLTQRDLLIKVSDCTSLFLAIGNHEGEQGWRRADPADSLPVWATLARKSTMANPLPDGFYTGNCDSTPCCGLRGDYFAWEWGDALFVVLDPFWYTMTSPHTGDPPYDGWDWTLGQTQYNWLYDTLSSSDARWKLVFAHHMTGGVEVQATPPRYYGRGGIEAAKYAVDGRPSFEWGGEDETGDYVFDTMRAGWGHGAVHDMLVSQGASVFFHGHDHVFVYQSLDGLVYQECPRPNDSGYNDAFLARGCYTHGESHKNSGHLRVTVASESLRVEYVRSVLPEDEPLNEDEGPVYNSDVSCSYTLYAAAGSQPTAAARTPRLTQNYPNPFQRSTSIAFDTADREWASLKVYDTRGRLVRNLFDNYVDRCTSVVRWDGCSPSGGRLAPGVYFYKLDTSNFSTIRKMTLLR